MWPAEQNLAHPTFWNNQVKTRNNNSYLRPCHRANFKAISQSSCRDTAWNAHLIHEIRVMYIWTTGIIGCACTVCINYQKWAGPFMTVQTLPTFSPNFGVPLLLPLLLGSGAIAFQKYHPNVSMIGQFYVFWTPFLVSSVRQLLVRFLQQCEAPRPSCCAPAFVIVAALSTEGCSWM